MENNIFIHESSFVDKPCEMGEELKFGILLDIMKILKLGKVVT